MKLIYSGKQRIGLKEESGNSQSYRAFRLVLKLLRYYLAIKEHIFHNVKKNLIIVVKNVL